MPLIQLFVLPAVTSYHRLFSLVNRELSRKNSLTGFAMIALIGCLLLLHSCNVLPFLLQKRSFPQMDKRCIVSRLFPTNRDKMVESWTAQMESKIIRAPSPFPLAQDPLLPAIESIVKAADARKASYVAGFRVFHLTEVTTFMVIIEGNSRAQIGAILDTVEVRNTSFHSAPVHSSRPFSD